MDCLQVQEAILDAFEQRGATEHNLDAHIASCPACAAFAARQQALDARLSALFPPPAAPTLSPAFRAGLRQRLQREKPVPQAPPRTAWLDAMPDVLHLASWGVATAASVALLPFDAMTIVGVGAAAATVTYVLLIAVRETIEDLPETYATSDSVRSIT